MRALPLLDAPIHFQIHSNADIESYRLNWFGFLACQDLLDEATSLVNFLSFATFRFTLTCTLE